MSRYLDLLERVLWTFAQGFAAEWIVTQSIDGQTLKVAAVAGAVAAVKCVLAFQVGSGNTAATLPAGPDTDLGGQT